MAVPTSWTSTYASDVPGTCAGQCRGRIDGPDGAFRMDGLRGGGDGAVCDGQRSGHRDRDGPERCLEARHGGQRAGGELQRRAIDVEGRQPRLGQVGGRFSERRRPGQVRAALRAQPDALRDGRASMPTTSMS